MYINFDLKGGVFDRHQAKRAAQELNLPYRKPFEWLTLGQVWKLLDCGYRDILEALWNFEVGSHKGFDIFAINVEGFYICEDECSTKGIKIHPDSVMKYVKKRAQKLLNKEKVLLKKLRSEATRD